MQDPASPDMHVSVSAAQRNMGWLSSPSYTCGKEEEGNKDREERKHGVSVLLTRALTFSPHQRGGIHGLPSAGYPQLHCRRELSVHLSLKLQPEDTQARVVELLLREASEWQLLVLGGGEEGSQCRKREENLPPWSQNFYQRTREMALNHSIPPVCSSPVLLPFCPKGDCQRAPLLDSSFCVFWFISFPNINAPCLFPAGQ